jgi:hypothetical protein
MNALPRQFEELADLVWALVNDRLDAAGASQLRQLLDDDATNRRVYIELMDQFASLEWERAEGERSQQQEKEQQKTSGAGAHAHLSGQRAVEPIESRAHRGPTQCPTAQCPTAQCPVTLCCGGSSSVASVSNEIHNRGACFSVYSVTTL